MSEPIAELTWLVERTKISHYLLDPNHPQGASKAKYLMAFGFTAAEPEQLAAALVHHAARNMNGYRVVTPPRGRRRFVFEGETIAPDGRLVNLRTVWEATGGGEVRFITAVPLTR